MRLLAVATRTVDGESAWTADDERDLVLEGFLSFSDPPLPDAKADGRGDAARRRRR